MIHAYLVNIFWINLHKIPNHIYISNQMFIKDLSHTSFEIELFFLLYCACIIITFLSINTTIDC